MNDILATLRNCSTHELEYYQKVLKEVYKYSIRITQRFQLFGSYETYFVYCISKSGYSRFFDSSTKWNSREDALRQALIETIEIINRLKDDTP